MKESIIKNNGDFQLAIQASSVLNPTDLISLDFVRTTFDVNGKVDSTSTYNFFLTKDEITKLSVSLLGSLNP